MKIAFRVDASATIGFGHLMRCLVLSDAFVRAGFEYHFFLQGNDDACRQMIRQRGGIVHEVSQEAAAIEMLADLSPDWIIFDGYDFDCEYELRWTPTGTKVLVIDDLANRPHQCNIIVDPTPGRTDEYSALAPGATELVGASYTLLDHRFSRVRDEVLAGRKLRKNVRKLLVTLGGGSMAAPLGVVADALKNVPLGYDVEITVLSRQDVRAAFDHLPNVRFIDHSDDMPRLLSESDICIGAAGGTSWERCCLGLPTVVLKVADNQTDNARVLSERGAAIHVPIDAQEIAAAVSNLISSGDLRTGMSEKAAEICDGKGAGRVFGELVSQSLAVRDANLDDARFIYDARYEGVDPSNYRSDSVPGYQDHVSWLKRELDNPAREFLVLELGGEPVAHIRLDRVQGDTQTVEIGIAIAETARGKGLGTAILETGCRHFFDKGGGEILAEVKHENHASKKIFDAAGFRLKEGGTDGFYSMALKASGA